MTRNLGRGPEEFRQLDGMSQRCSLGEGVGSVEVGDIIRETVGRPRTCVSSLTHPGKKLGQCQMYFFRPQVDVSTKEVTGKAAEATVTSTSC